MKTISVGLATLFTSGNNYLMADCYTITLKNNSVIKYAIYDTDITYGGNTWLSNAPVIVRNNTRVNIGLEVGTLQVDVSPNDTDLIGTQTWLQAVCAGVLDGALLKLDRAFMDLSGKVAGTVNVFTGYVAQLSINRSTVSMTVNSPLDGLSIQMPRNLYQSACQHSLFDSGCTAVRATFTSSNTVTGAITVASFTTALGAAAGYYDLGTIKFTSGALTGTKRTVKSWDGTTLTLLNPLPQVPASGDAFSISAGCDKQVSTCTNKFSNAVNFKGFPFVPVPETVS